MNAHRRFVDSILADVQALGAQLLEHRKRSWPILVELPQFFFSHEGFFCSGKGGSCLRPAFLLEAALFLDLVQVVVCLFNRHVALQGNDTLQGPGHICRHLVGAARK